MNLSDIYAVMKRTQLEQNLVQYETIHKVILKEKKIGLRIHLKVKYVWG